MRDGIPFVTVPLALTIAPAVFGQWWLVAVLLVVAGFMAFFFRDPSRSIPHEPGLIVAPADGRITHIRHDESGGGGTVVSIFLSPLNVHINRSPIAGQITDISYSKGRFLMATSPEASRLNEQNSLTIKGDDVTVSCKQIAGILARRIVCWKSKGDTVGLGERFGMIKFGSRTDVAFNAPVELLVREGMSVRAGETAIARLIR